MKLNYKRVILVGFAFFLICAFWQAYDTIVPKILTDKFGMTQTASGFVMTLDNILALFMLPMFGAISDKCNAKMGKRTPFVLFGTIAAVISFMAMSFADNMQLLKIQGIEGLSDAERQAYAWDKVVSDPTALIVFIVALLAALVSMATFRSPAVALMPDVVIKPLRSKANAVINLMGTFGGILVLVLGMVFKTGADENRYMNYIVFFGCIAAIMILALVIFMITVRENKWAADMQAESKEYGIDESDEDSNEGDRKLSGGELASLIFILLSVFLWYMGYNAVTSKYSVYATSVLKIDYNSTLLLANAAAIVSYIPVGFISSRIGRKKSILAGIVMLAAAFGFASTIREGSSPMIMNVLFALAGIGWATINVNSFPMVVELAKGSTIGKYTGYYYAFSMAAQALTPTISGVFMDNIGMTTLFPYATIFVILSFITMLVTRHGDNKPTAKKGLEALDVGD